MDTGLIGFGAWGKFHARAIASHPELRLAAIACNSPETAALARREYPDAAVYSDFRDLVRESSVELVDIVLPIYLHADAGIAALEAGKNVILEKPMARTPEECDRLIAAAASSHRLLTISHDWRASNNFADIKRLLTSGEFGDLRYMSINLFRNRFRSGAGDWRITPEKVGSWILEEPVHFFDLALWYMQDHGDPTSIWAIGNGPRSEDGLYENFTATLRFAGGAYATVTFTLAGFEHHSLVELAGNKGAARTWWSATMDRAEGAQVGYQVRTRDMPFVRGENECRSIKIEPENHQVKISKQLDRIVQAFKAGKEPTPGKEARKRVLLCQEAVRSAREGIEIEIVF